MDGIKSVREAVIDNSTHSVKPGTVTVVGAMSKDLPLGTLRQIYRQAGLPGRPK